MIVIMSNIRKPKGFAVLFLWISFSSISGQRLQPWLTTFDGTNQLQRLADMEPEAGPIGGYILQVTGPQIQGIDGFGAGLTNAAAYVLYRADAGVRDDVLRALFDKDAGIGMEYIRITMGTSDLSWAGPYTYDDIPYGQTDFDMNSFSIDKDREYIIPIIKQIKQINPRVAIMATPYSLPAWMKDTKSLFGGSMRLEPEYQAAAAKYFVRFIKAYEAEGIKIDSITLVNEPRHSSRSYPTTKMGANLQKDIIRYHLGPMLQNEGIDVKIFIWDHNWDYTSYPLQVLDDPVARDIVGGVAWHCYAGNRFDPTTVRRAHPNIDFSLTECSAGSWDDDFDSAFTWSLQNVFIGQTRIGARSAMYKSLVLDEKGGPRRGVIGGCENCRGVITLKPDGTWSKSPEYFATGHFSKFVAQGATHIFSTSLEDDELETSAFENPDGKKVIIVLNTSSWQGKRFDLEVNSRWYNFYELSPRSAVTFVTE